MTRKRFVKLVMSHGKSRNEAQTIALLARVSGKSYSKAYNEGTLPNPFAEAAKGLMKIMMPFGTALTEMFESYLKTARALLYEPIARQLVNYSENHLEGDDIGARSYAGGSPEVDGADLLRDEVHGATVEQTEHSGTVSG